MDKLNVQDLVNIIKNYREELANAMEVQLTYKALNEKYLQHIQNLETQLQELRPPVESKGDDE
jgi:hypothetical protein